MSFAWIIAVGLAVGVIAELLMPKGHPGGRNGTIILGMGGAVLTGILGWSEHWYALNQPLALVASGIGAVIMLTIYRLIIPAKAPGHRDIRKAA